LNILIEIKSDSIHSIVPRREFSGNDFLSIFLTFQVQEFPMIKIECKSIKNLCQGEVGEFAMNFLRTQTHEIIISDMSD